MATCASCGTTVADGSAHLQACPMVGPPRSSASDAYAFDLPPNPSNLPWAPPLPSGAAPATSTVDAFDDGLAPFFGDPNKSRLLGKGVQIAAGLLALYSLGRAGAWLYFASLTSTPLTAVSTLAEQERVLGAGRLVDGIDVLFWPTIIVMVVVDLLWRRARRPKDVLAARGEAYVEATISRAVPVTYRVLGIALMVGGFLVNMTLTSSKTIRPDQVSSYASTRALSSAAFAAGWAMFIVWVWMSEAHLASRVAKAADPALAGYSVPFIVPEGEPTTFGPSGRSEGGGWLLRTAGLLIGGLVAFFGAIAGLSGLGKDPLPAIAILLVSLAVLALVVWAFVRRRQRRRSSAVAS